jgi:hypothetical protein
MLIVLRKHAIFYVTFARCRLVGAPVSTLLTQVKSACDALLLEPIASNMFVPNVSSAMVED